MKVAGLRLALGAPEPTLAAMVDEYARREPTHADGLDPALLSAAGYWSLSMSAPLGHGDELLARAGDLLLSWAVHRRAGLAVAARGPATAGSTVVMGTGWGPVRIVVPCRVVESRSSGADRGFTYWTLPDHPERGGERFTVTRDHEGAVTFSVSAVARPAGLLASLGAPVTRTAARRATARYLTAMRALVG